MSKNVAILMAAGHGSRMDSVVPKQFMPVQGRMLMEFSLQTFQNHPGIDEILIVLPEEYLGETELLEHFFSQYSKVNSVLAGGEERFQSSWSSIQWFADRRDDRLLLHDAARPGVTPRIIDDLLEALEHSEAAVTATPATDTVLKVGEGMQLEATLDRKSLYYAQTPQAFRAGLLYDCFEQLFADGTFVPTDESGVVAHYRPDVPIRIVQGAPGNFKVTYPEDVLRINFE
ncbi:MAG: 2-C-methyl-D-erythritol 4-phosphate cytidylyltransferase [Bacteroidales bacterium]|nr:2-C-methyl-D-erythritol 4-phosphate cytidylyltransferase [Bacteroidales bacterium]